MRRVHILPYVTLAIFGLIIIFSFDSWFGLLFGFILATLGISGSAYHLAVDEHITA